LGGAKEGGGEGSKSKMIIAVVQLKEGGKLVKMKKKITNSKNKHALKPRIVMKRVPKNTASCQS
jgi:hypothetical protein